MAGIIPVLEKDILDRASVIKSGRRGVLSQIIVRSFNSFEDIVDISQSEGNRSCFGILTPPSLMAFEPNTTASPIQRITTTFTYKFAIVDTSFRSGESRRSDVYSMHEPLIASLKDRQFEIESVTGFEDYKIYPYEFSSNPAEILETPEFIFIIYNFSAKVMNKAVCEVVS